MSTAKQRLGLAVVLVAGALLAQAASAQAPPAGVFSEVQAVITPRISPALEPATVRSRVVQANTQKITAARRGREVLKLNLFDDAVVEVAIKRVRPTQSGYFISGAPASMEWGEVRLVVNGPVMVGTVVTPQGKFTIRSGGGGRHVIRQIDPSKEPFECVVEKATVPGPSPQPRDLPAISSIDPMPAGVFLPAPQAEDLPTEDGSEVRLLVVYTPAAQRKQGGPAGMTAFIDLLIQTANQAFEDSGINPRLVLAHAAMVDYVETASRDELTALSDPADGHMDEVHGLRNEHAADLVHLLADPLLGPAGSAARPYRESLDLAESYYYAVTNYASEETFTHEIGHNFGLKHERYISSLSGTIYPYAFGYTNKRALEPDAPRSARWRTIMSYGRQCGHAGFNCPRLLRFSNPDQTHLGDALGVPANSRATGVDGPADARLAINNSARWVGSFRSEACTEFTIAQDAHIAPLDGGQISIQVDAGIGCIWEASSNAEFITIESDRRQAGSGFASVIVAANQTNAERTGTLTVAGKSISVRQLAVSGGVCNRTTAVMQLMTERAGFADAAQCNQVTDEHLARIDLLDLSHQGLTQLKEGDFDGLIALRELHLYRNRLTELPAGLFDGLSELRRLLLDDNRLTEVNGNHFADLSALEVLNLERNQIAGLSEDLFASLSKLKHVILPHNRITRISEKLLAGTPQLESFDIGYNDISDLPAGLFNGLPNLSTLVVTSNRIAHLPANLFEELASLEVLALDFNRLEALPSGSFSELSNLREIRLSSNRLTVLPAGLFAGLSSLQHLSLDFNRLTELPADSFADLTALRWLGLNSNLISDIPSRLFAGLTNLRVLGLDFNRLNQLPPGLFAGLGMLEYLNLSANQIAELPNDSFAGLWSLERLLLADNRLTDLPAGIFSDLTSLLELNLAINSLTGISDGVFAGSAQLDSVNLSRNDIDPLILLLSLEKEGEDQIKAVVPSAAPFAMELPLSVSGGTIEGGTSLVTLPAGVRESSAFRVIRESGSAEPVSVDLGPLPILPNNHVGYVLGKDDSLPLRILPSSLPNDAQLIRISLSEGELDPAFSTEVQQYSTLVGHGVSRLTVSPTPSNGNAAVAFLDAGDEALTDANATADGHQVDLSVGRNAIKVKVRSEDATHTETYELVVTRDGAADGCIRSAPVRQAILAAIPGTDACGELTREKLATITELDLSSKEISSLGESDFAGLVALEELDLRNNQLRSLPSGIFSDLKQLQSIRLEWNELRSLPVGVFSGLSSLDILRLAQNQLVDLPSGIFSGLTALRVLNLGVNRLSNLPADVFSGLTTLEELRLYLNRLTELPSGIFSDLTALRVLTLYENRLIQLRPDIFAGLDKLEELFLTDNVGVTDLPPGIFDELPALERLEISGLGLTALREGVFAGLSNLRSITLGDSKLENVPAGIFAGLHALQRLSLWRTEITSLPKGLFSGLKSLREINLEDNRLSNLPDGILAGLSALTRLNLRGNAIDPMPLSISLEKVGNSQFKAVVPTGAPFTLSLPVHVGDSGRLKEGISAITIPLGAIESMPVEVMRVAGSEEAVIVSLGELPDLPDRHEGYYLESDPTLPRTILPGPRDPPPAQVTGVELTPGFDEITVSWTAVTDAGGYRVQWKSGDEEFDELRQAVVSGGETVSHTITDLTAGTEFTVRVIAIRDQAEDGAPSVEVTGEPMASPPAQVTGVAAESAFEELVVSWTAVSDANGYKVQWKSGEEDYAESRQVALLGAETTRYTIIDLTTDTEYTVRVIATKEHADDGPPSEEVAATPANPDPDVNADGTLDGDDAQVMYQAYASEERVGDGESGGTAESRRTLLSGLAATADPSDDDLRAMLRKAHVWKVVGLAHGGDINEDGLIDGDDAFVMYYAYEFADLVGDGETGGTARHRQHLLASRSGKDNPTDEDLKKMLRRANQLKEDFG